jgi:hypothetical protein
VSSRSGPFWDSVDGRIPLGNIAFVEGSLYDPHRAIVATATAKARVIAFEPPAS